MFLGIVLFILWCSVGITAVWSTLGFDRKYLSTALMAGIAFGPVAIPLAFVCVAKYPAPKTKQTRNV